MTAGPSGDVCVTDRGNHRVQKLDASGALLAKWGTQGSGDGQLQAVFRVAADACAERPHDEQRIAAAPGSYHDARRRARRLFTLPAGQGRAAT